MHNTRRTNERDDAKRPADAIVALPRGDGEARWWFEGLATLKLTAGETGGRFSLTEMLYPARAVVPRHVHHREDELFYILDGELESPRATSRCPPRPTRQPARRNSRSSAR